LEAEKRHDFAYFASKRNRKNLKQKRTGYKRKEAKKSKQNEKEKLLNQENYEGRLYSCISTDVLMYLI
jgi:hypothetical protein